MVGSGRQLRLGSEAPRGIELRNLFAHDRRRRTEMPSPIPGMDPFLEDPAVFPDLHDNLIAELRNAINAKLPPPYYASSASRVWVEPSQRRLGPDVDVLRPERPG